jgi:hypothetical protein
VTPGELVEILARIEAKQDWLVRAVTALLATEAGVELDEAAEWVAEDDLENWLATVGVEPEADPNEHVAVRRPPKAAQEAPCGHQHQVLVRGAVTCANCGQKLVQGGIVGDPNRNGRAAEQTEWGQFSIQESNV